MGAALPLDACSDSAARADGSRAVRALSDWMTTGAVSASVHMLVKGVLEIMLWNKLRTTAATVFRSGFSHGRSRCRRLGCRRRFKRAPHAATKAPRSAFVERDRPNSHRPAKSGEVWSLTLAEAIRIGLD